MLTARRGDIPRRAAPRADGTPSLPAGGIGRASRISWWWWTWTSAPSTCWVRRNAVRSSSTRTTVRPTPVAWKVGGNRNQPIICWRPTASTEEPCVHSAHI